MSRVRKRAAVVGGGIVGVSVARHLARRVDGFDVTLFEKEDRLAAHQTGHNSGVVHAGLYYEPGSLKATLCLRGVELLREAVRDHGVPYEECGKIVVALGERELPRLDAVHARAVANGVPGVRLIGRDEITELEPHARGIRALHSPRTAIVDYVALTAALAEDFRAAGGSVRLGEKVTGLEHRGRAVRLTTGRGTEEFDLVIACAGLASDRLARAAGESAEPRIVPFYGDYFLLDASTRHLVNGLIYPVPDPRYPFLGVHLTKRIDGAVMLGPNAFLSLGRESYEGRRPVPRDVRDALGFPGFWRFAARNLPAAAREARTALSSRRFVAEARRYVPAIPSGAVVRGPRGIRAQAMDARGGLVDDFVISGTEHIVHVRNAPSPGATSALAIAEHIVSEALRRRSWTPA
ncbi:L-2-hydroxyglutarate oxidase [Actinomadura madurae]|uniref:L-2-hydroxyglutarate oxidase LhgO n=1 Tax=Actinomadura madurae TaxID=1993 RepID=A0A1I5RHW4_9ACTN|nr:L-2-hydroxyglutarate oxidase [Actinomadura madurae]SFP58128.1 L-2-hydroxyglutarate oxidase LhgO [Actinomadura madurae]SPT59271.1 L-2-hydroxyglutarate oxidase LhgO [Actinomadura madurae]